MARPSCFRLLTHWARLAAARADWTAGRGRAIRTAVMAVASKGAIRVNPRCLADVLMGMLLGGMDHDSQFRRYIPIRVGPADSRPTAVRARDTWIWGGRRGPRSPAGGVDRRSGNGLA